MQRVNDMKEWLTEQTTRMSRLKVPTRKARRGRYRADALAR